MSTPTIPFYPVTHDDGTNIVSALNNIASAKRMPIVVADAFSTLESYDIGDYVIYENNMYRFTSAHSAGVWDSTQVVRVTVGEELKDLSENLDSINSSISAIDNSLAIISDGDIHIAISSGEYIYIKNHNILAEGLYTANSSIGANVPLTTSNVTTVDNKGGFNKTISIAHGGTNASDVINARKNLGSIGMFCAEAVFAAECIQIPWNANLNTQTYTATGKYCVPTNAQTQTITNCPTLHAFQMLVFNLLTDNTGPINSISQWNSRTRILITYEGEIFIQFVEQASNGTTVYWNSWKKITMT